MSTAAVLLVRRARLFAVFGGLCWLLGLTPAAPVRLLVVGLVVAGGVLDALSDAGLRTTAVRITTLRGGRQ